LLNAAIYNFVFESVKHSNLYKVGCLLVLTVIFDVSVQVYG